MTMRFMLNILRKRAHVCYEKYSAMVPSRMSCGASLPAGAVNSKISSQRFLQRISRSHLADALRVFGQSADGIANGPAWAALKKHRPLIHTISVPSGLDAGTGQAVGANVTRRCVPSDECIPHGHLGLHRQMGGQAGACDRSERGDRSHGGVMGGAA